LLLKVAAFIEGTMALALITGLISGHQRPASHTCLWVVEEVMDGYKKLVFAGAAQLHQHS